MAQQMLKKCKTLETFIVFKVSNSIFALLIYERRNRQKS